MDAQHGKQVVDAIQAAGLSVVLTADQSVKVTPASGLTLDLRALIRSNKSALVKWLQKPPASNPAGTPSTAPDKVRAASLALDAVILASGMEADPDCWCWPESTALNTAEMEAFTVRLSRFTDMGLTMSLSESLADKLVIRDRDGDDRRLCLECPHLAGYAGTWRCGNWEQAEIATRAVDARLAGEEVTLLRRCAGFGGQL